MPGCRSPGWPKPPAPVQPASITSWPKHRDMHNFLVIGVPLLCIVGYIFTAGIIHGLIVKWFKKTSWHKRRDHTNYSHREVKNWCDDCTMTAGMAAAFWPIAGIFLLGQVLATKKRLKK